MSKPFDPQAVDYHDYDARGVLTLVMKDDRRITPPEGYDPGPSGLKAVDLTPEYLERKKR
jgi:hypothetical protein